MNCDLLNPKFDSFIPILNAARDIARWRGVGAAAPPSNSVINFFEYSKHTTPKENYFEIIGLHWALAF